MKSFFTYMRLHTLSCAALIGLAIAIVQRYALTYNWYWEYWWLDLAMHFAGGVVVTLTATAFLGARLATVFVMLCVAIAWEVYEYVIGATFVREDLYRDTALDLVFGLIGGVSLYGIMHLWLKYGSRLTAVRGVSPDQISS